MFGVPAKVRVNCRGNRLFYKLFTWNGYVLLVEDVDSKPFIVEDSMIKEEEAL